MPHRTHQHPSGLEVEKTYCPRLLTPGYSLTRRPKPRRPKTVSIHQPSLLPRPIVKLGVGITLFTRNDSLTLCPLLFSQFFGQHLRRSGSSLRSNRRLGVFSGQFTPFLLYITTFILKYGTFQPLLHKPCIKGLLV